MENPAKGGVEAVPFGESSEDLVRGYVAEFNALFGHGFETVLELVAESGEIRWWTIGPRSPRK